MLKRMLVMGLALGIAALVVSSCGSTTTSVTTISTGSLLTFVGDVPACGVVNFRSEVQGLALTPVGGDIAFPVFGGASSRQLFYKVGFGKLRDFSTFLDIGKVPVGSYDKATFAFLSPTLLTYDPNLDPPIRFTVPTFPSSTPTFSINPPLVITNGGLTGLQADFNLRKSITLDNNGQVTSIMTPVMSFTPINPTASGGFGDLDDLKGFVTSVTPSTTGAGFTGGFAFQTLSGTGPLVTANLTRSTQICGPPTSSNQVCAPIQLNQLLTGSFIEMDGFMDSLGNLVANSIEVEDQEVPENNQLAFIGEVMPNSITRDANGNVSQFNLYVSEEEPDDSLYVPLDTVVVVNLSSSTIYQADGRPESPGSTISANFVNLPFDATSINAGQELVVHGVFKAPPVSTTGAVSLTTVAADKVFLKLQSHLGNFSSLVAAQADDRTGGFWMATCGNLFQGAPGAPILVLTNSQTTFLNLTGLSALTPQPALIIKGLLFYDLPGGSLNGTAVPPGTLVLVAKQVHQAD
ncbi:MAG TPA: hypothetical protein VG028_01515 [Terriglobia bacterium]|nr:hypothetical protein [Terriglobia bacterium]